MAARKSRILLAEQRNTTTGVTLHSLCADETRRFELKVVSNHARLFEHLRTFRPDVAIVDLALLGPNPAGAIFILRAVVLEMPLILLANPTDKECAVACLEAGATDYMLEGFMDERTLDRTLHTALFGTCGLLPARFSRTLAEANSRAKRGSFPETDRRQHLEGIMRMKIGMRVTLRNLQDMKDRIGAAAAERILEGVGSFLKKNLRGTDQCEQRSTGEFHLSISNADSAGLRALQKRISTTVLQNHFHTATDCALDFCVENEAPTNNGVPASAEELDKAVHNGSGRLVFLR